MKANRHIQYKALRLAAPNRFIKTKYIGRTAFALITFLVILNLWTVIDGKTNIPKGSNVILISIDTLRADHLGCYGYGKNTTPNVDEFSKDSVLFKETIAQASSTLPSHASIFTSLIPSHHGAFFNENANTTKIRNYAGDFKRKQF